MTRLREIIQDTIPFKYDKQMLEKQLPCSLDQVKSFKSGSQSRQKTFDNKANTYLGDSAL